MLDHLDALTPSSGAAADDVDGEVAALVDAGSKNDICCFFFGDFLTRFRCCPLQR